LSVRCLLTVIRTQVSGLPVTPRCARPVSTLAASLRGPERPLGQAPASSCRRTWGGVHGGLVDRPPRRWSTSHGPCPSHFLLENNSGIKYSSHFSFRPLSLSKINPQSLIFSVRPRNPKIFTKRSLVSEKSTKNSSKTSKIHIFPTTTPNPVILVPKFLESLPLSFYAFI
jgi:hypothetical protein